MLPGDTVIINKKLDRTREEYRFKKGFIIYIKIAKAGVKYQKDYYKYPLDTDMDSLGYCKMLLTEKDGSYRRI
jgi:hypothetical protein